MSYLDDLYEGIAHCDMCGTEKPYNASIYCDGCNKAFQESYEMDMAEQYLEEQEYRNEGPEE